MDIDPADAGDRRVSPGQVEPPPQLALDVDSFGG
jgi:hypothetical protein